MTCCCGNVAAVLEACISAIIVVFNWELGLALALVWAQNVNHRSFTFSFKSLVDCQFVYLQLISRISGQRTGNWIRRVRVRPANRRVLSVARIREHRVIA